MNRARAWIRHRSGAAGAMIGAVHRTAASNNAPPDLVVRDGATGTGTVTAPRDPATVDHGPGRTRSPHHRGEVRAAALARCRAAP